MKATLISAGLLAGVSLTVSPGSSAQLPGNLSVDVRECLALSSEVERLACYDRIAAVALTEGAEHSDETQPAIGDERDDIAGSDGHAAPADRPVGNDDLVNPAGPTIVSDGPADNAQERRAGNAPEQPGEIFSTITALEQYLPNAYVVTLENGQVWRQVDSKRYPLRTGYTVRVYRSRWGDSYRLSAEVLNGFIRIEPVE